MPAAGMPGETAESHLFYYLSAPFLQALILVTATVYFSSLFMKKPLVNIR